MAYRHLLAAQVRSQAQYRASLAVDVVGSVLFGVLDIVSVVVLFRVTPTLGGFGFAEVFLMTALASCAFATADLVVGNVERLRQYVVGFAFVAYYPTLALVDRPDPLGAPAFLGYAAPAIAVMAAVAAGLAWQTGVRHYRSTGS